ncbi:MAG TPA: cytochrome c oxidase assembly protein [Steroidobacteraceae bacterium]|nr:cytochrome c oxidase assembly protein [Steroidobacteraceae bacterium]
MALHWSAEPAVLVPIAVSTLWYLIGFARLRQLPALAPLYGPRQLLCYLGGELTLVLALLSPLDELADQLFSAHMFEHMLLLMVAAPLLVWGRPAVAFLWAFGPVGRKRLGCAWRALGITAGVNGLMHPIVVWGLFCGVFIGWHLPGPYQWALHDETVHTFEHVTFLASALMFWTIVIEPSGRRRLSYGATLLFVLATAVVSSLPGAVITLAATPLYPDYASSTARWGWSLLEDQQLAGLLMWLPGGIVYLIAAGGAIVRWLQFDESRHPARHARATRRATMAATIATTAHGRTSPAKPIAGRAASMALLICGCGLLLLSLSGCGSSQAAANAANDPVAASDIGNPQRGADLIRAAGCGACHVVPGINDASGLVGPPLTQMARRIYIAGLLRNTPENMIEWLRSPQSVLPGNAMPDSGLSDDQARDITAYLYTLR